MLSCHQSHVWLISKTCGLCPCAKKSWCGTEKTLKISLHAERTKMQMEQTRSCNMSCSNISLDSGHSDSLPTAIPADAGSEFGLMFDCFLIYLWKHRVSKFQPHQFLDTQAILGCYHYQTSSINEWMRISDFVRWIGWWFASYTKDQLLLARFDLCFFGAFGFWTLLVWIAKEGTTASQRQGFWLFNQMARFLGTLGCILPGSLFSHQNVFQKSSLLVECILSFCPFWWSEDTNTVHVTESRLLIPYAPIPFASGFGVGFSG